MHKKDLGLWRALTAVVLLNYELAREREQPCSTFLPQKDDCLFAQISALCSHWWLLLAFVVKEVTGGTSGVTALMTWVLKWQIPFSFLVDTNDTISLYPHCWKGRIGRCCSMCWTVLPIHWLPQESRVINWESSSVFALLTFTWRQLHYRRVLCVFRA